GRRRSASTRRSAPSRIATRPPCGAPRSSAASRTSRRWRPRPRPPKASSSCAADRSPCARSRNTTTPAEAAAARRVAPRVGVTGGTVGGVPLPALRRRSARPDRRRRVPDRFPERVEQRAGHEVEGGGGPRERRPECRDGGPRGSRLMRQHACERLDRLAEAVVVAGENAQAGERRIGLIPCELGGGEEEAGGGADVLLVRQRSATRGRDGEQ